MDEITKPKYYTQGSVECIDAIDAMLGKDAMIDFYRGQVVKCIWRMKLKGDPIKDAKKAQFYLNQLVMLVD
jgi:hypothetical protein